MGVKERKEILNQLEGVRTSRVLCCVTSDREGANGVIAKDFIPIFFEHLRAFGYSKRVDVFMFTSGGDTIAAFGLSRLVRSFTRPDGRFGVLVPEKCHSGGTLFLLGADEVVMTPAATLSPIDPSIQSALGPTIEVQPGQRMPLPVSVESVAAFFELAKNDWRLSEAGIASAFAALTEKIHPIVLGDVYRSRQQIERLATTLLESHVDDETSVNNAVRKLTREFGSHDYLISRDEAASFLKILPKAAENQIQEELMWRLYEDFRVDMDLGRLYMPGVEVAAAKAAGTLPAKISQKIVIIESTNRSDLWRRDIILSERIVPSPAGPVPVPQQEIAFNGWC